MSECTHNCSTCGESCAERATPQSLRKAPHPESRIGKEGKLFGAITSKEISEGLASQFQLDVPKQKIVLDEPIKAFGTYEVKAKLGYEVSARFSVSVSEE